MTEQSNAELIAEARLAECSECSEEGTSPEMRCDGDLIRRLADALEAADQRAAELAAVVEKALAVANDSDQGDSFLPTIVALESAPADALREHDAALIEKLADELPLAFQAAREVLWEKARQRREEQS